MFLKSVYYIYIYIRITQVVSDEGAMICESLVSFWLNSCIFWAWITT